VHLLQWYKHNMHLYITIYTYLHGAIGIMQYKLLDNARQHISKWFKCIRMIIAAKSSYV